MDTVFDSKKVAEHIVRTKSESHVAPSFIREKFLNRKNKRTETPDKLKFEQNE